MIKILTIIGARPQFIKASVVSKAIQSSDLLSEQIVHTGQHFDENMSNVFFEQLGIPKPDFQLDINGGTHGSMTGKMLEALEAIMIDQSPDRVLVYGDTNSTLAGALAASKLHIPVAHIEAGLRSFNMAMPEEINRILTDQVSDILFCPTETAIKNLTQEGLCSRAEKVVNVGDVMQDSALFFSQNEKKPECAFDFNKDFVLATIHRAENTDDQLRLKGIVKALNDINASVAPVILPLHPRTRKVIESLDIELNVSVIDPVGYFEMLWMLKRCGLVVTDSGGLQKEAFFFGKACVTTRDQTEWVELLDCGANALAGANSEKIVSLAGKNFGRKVEDEDNLYGGGMASSRIVESLVEGES